MSEGRDNGGGAEAIRGTYVPLPLECVECRTLSDPEARHWRSYRIDDPSEGELPALASYCPVCAEREFGELGQSWEPRNMHW